MSGADWWTLIFFCLTFAGGYLMGRDHGREQMDFRWRRWRDAEWDRGKDIGRGPLT